MLPKKVTVKKPRSKAPRLKPGMPKTPPGVQGPAMIVKKRDGNRPVKIY